MDRGKYLATLTMNGTHFSQWAERSHKGCYLYIKPEYAHGIQFIAVEGQLKEWACYYGPLHFPLEEIELNGYKLFEEDARPLFPYLQNLHYRS